MIMTVTMLSRREEVASYQRLLSDMISGYAVRHVEYHLPLVSTDLF